MGFFKRLSNFTAKIGTPENSKTQNILNLVKFLMSRPGMRFAKSKLKQSLYGADRFNPESYHNWILNRSNPDLLATQYKQAASGLKRKPVISIVMPVYDPKIKFLSQAIESVIGQSYPEWELCMADDLSPNPEVQQLLEEYSKPMATYLPPQIPLWQWPLANSCFSWTMTTC